MDRLTNNIPELCGVEQKLRTLLYEYNMATREGTLNQMANRLMLIRELSRGAEEVIIRKMFPMGRPPEPPEEDE